MRFKHNLQTGKTTEHEDAPITPIVEKTAQELDVEKTKKAKDLSSSILAESIIEEVTLILAPHGITIPSNFMGNVEDNIKGKL